VFTRSGAAARKFIDEIEAGQVLLLLLGLPSLGHLS
jgi:hypothetical protein